VIDQGGGEKTGRRNLPCSWRSADLRFVRCSLLSQPLAIAHAALHDCSQLCVPAFLLRYTLVFTFVRTLRACDCAVKTAGQSIRYYPSWWAPALAASTHFTHHPSFKPPIAIRELDPQPPRLLLLLARKLPRHLSKPGCRLCQLTPLVLQRLQTLPPLLELPPVLGHHAGRVPRCPRYP